MEPKTATCLHFAHTGYHQNTHEYNLSLLKHFSHSLILLGHQNFHKAGKKFCNGFCLIFVPQLLLIRVVASGADADLHHDKRIMDTGPANWRNSRSSGRNDGSCSESAYPHASRWTRLRSGSGVIRRDRFLGKVLDNRPREILIRLVQEWIKIHISVALHRRDQNRAPLKGWCRISCAVTREKMINPRELDCCY